MGVGSGANRLAEESAIGTPDWLVIASAMGVALAVMYGLGLVAGMLGNQADARWTPHMAPAAMTIIIR